MKFQFSRYQLPRKEKRLQRFLEVLPGATSWSLLLGMITLSIWKPLPAAVIVIAFNLYWVFRLFYMTIFLVISYIRLSIEQNTDWMQRIGWLDAFLEARKGPAYPAAVSWKQRISQWICRREINQLLKAKALPVPSAGLYHLVVIPVARELPAILSLGLDGLSRQTFPTKRIIVVFALEAWAPPKVREGVLSLQKRYHATFYDVLVVEHPQGLPGEAKVKGANVTFAAKAAAALLESRSIAPERVIASCFDADTVVGEDYMSCLTYTYMVTADRTRASFQPIPVFHNNIWEAPAFTRVLDIGSSFFQLVEATHPDRLVTFSSHSMSFKALVDVDFWPVDMISDDSAIYWKAFIHYDGSYRVVPLYLTVSMDAVHAGSWWKTVVNVYKQKRRWAWGVENFPLVVRAFLRARRIPVFTRVRAVFKLFEGHVAWATWAFLLTAIGWLPALFAGREFSDSVLYYSAPRITGIIFHLSALALVVTIILSLCLLPKPPRRFRRLNHLLHAGEWLAIPVVATLLSALPALDAQTRLMRGRYMEFWVTEKSRKGIESNTENAYDELLV